MHGKTWQTEESSMEASDNIMVVTALYVLWDNDDEMEIESND